MEVTKPDEPDERANSSAREKRPRRRKATLHVRARLGYDAGVIPLNWERIGLAVSFSIIVLLLAERISILRNAPSGQQGGGSNVVEAKVTPRPRSIASASPNVAIQAADVQPIEAAAIEATEATRRPTPPSEHMDFEDIVALRQQGLQLLANGDFTAGRMALQRAAKAGDAPARAALGWDDAASEQSLFEKAMRVTRDSAAAR